MTARLLLLTDRTLVPPGRTLDDVLREAAAAGLTRVVLRETDLPDDERQEIADTARSAALEVIAAHRPLLRTVGLHLPASASRPGQALRWGRSCHSRTDVARAASDGAWWATLSPYTWTESKPGYGPPLSDGAFTGHSVPIYALGGVTPDNAEQARKAGAYGVAVMGAVMRADDPAAVVADLLRAVAP
ncbi:thiamine phosphate synthase [Nocardioides sp. WS12]|uniref:thiamine phosphate synthase n=1 Tax=Nocardioides sp. WS12 TaxID=2486272 RepID=UPI0015F7EF14|nr:thiamine phosphate synthase [Nocardioides sp. WS12]